MSSRQTTPDSYDSSAEDHLETFAAPLEESELQREIVRLARILRALRAPTGCPWDREQTHESLAPYAIEEVYELVAAIETGDAAELRDELGDVLLQVVFHAQLAGERQAFDLADVARQISEKLIRRHPHVFGSEQANSADDVKSIWAEAKRQEGRVESAFTVSEGMPPLLRAAKLTKKAAKLGFDWDLAEDVVPVLMSEVEELREELKVGDVDAAAEELGDVLFSAVNLARKMKRDPEQLLRAANRKFERRFRGLLGRAKVQGLDVSEMSLTDMEELWNEVKRHERKET